MSQEKAMLDIANDIHSLSHFKRNTPALMKRLKETGNPIVLTVNGKAEVVVQDAAAYQRLAQLAEKAEMIQFLEEDRKSTRLNSSHMSISYAVFCLKKKTTDLIRHVLTA